MKFLFLCHNHPGYGTFFRAFQLGRHLVRRGHRVVLMLVSRERSWRWRRYGREGVWIVECPNFQPFIPDKEDGWGPLDILLRCAYGLAHGFDAVVGFGHKPDIAIPALLLRYLKRVPFIADWCDLWGDGGIFSVRGILGHGRRGGALDRFAVRAETFLERAVVRLADGVTVICTRLEKMARERRAARGRVLLLRSGCDIEGIRPMDAAAARRALGLPGGTILEYMGNYLQEALLLSRAFERLAPLLDDARLLIVGPRLTEIPEAEASRLGEGLRELRALSLRMGGRVIWAGRRRYDEIPAFLAAADLLLLPMEESELERGRWPNKVCDYLAAGRPIAATDVGDVGAAVREKECGIVSMPDAEDYCRAVMAALSDRALLDRLGANARRLAEGEMSWGSIASRFLDFVLELRRAGA